MITDVLDVLARLKLCAVVLFHMKTNTVHKCLGGVRLEDGTLAGSALTMDQAFRNIISIGL
jgi:N-acetylglucosamine-6-phosphate deacetylase